MSCNYLIRPEALNILGGSQSAYGQNQRVQEDPPREETWWEKIKSNTKKALSAIKRALVCVKEYLVPIMAATAGLLNAWGNYQRYKNERYATCGG